MRLITGFKILNFGLYKNAVSNYNPNNDLKEFIKKYLESFFSQKYGEYLEFSDLFPKLDQLSTISTGKNKSSLNGEKGTHSGGSHPPFVGSKKGLELRDNIPRDYRVVSPKELSDRILKVREEIGIWISKTDMDHVLRWNAKMDLSNAKEHKLFAKIIKKFKVKRNCQCEFYNLEGYKDGPKEIKVNQDRTGWIHPIKTKDGYCLTVSLHESHKQLENIKKDMGTIRIKLKRNMDLQLIFEHYFKIFHFLTEDEHQQLLELYLDERELLSKNQMFYIELANAIGPKKTVDEELKAGHVKVFLRNGYGGKSEINVVVDYSKGPELEVKGPARPSLTLRKLVVDPVGAADSIASIDYKINNSITNQNSIIKNQDVINDNLEFLETEVYSTNQSVILLQENSIHKNEILSEFSEVQARQFGHEIQTDLYQIELKEHLKQLFESARANSDNTAGIVIALDKGIQKLKENYSDVFEDFEKEVFTGINIVSDKLDKLDKKISDEFKDLKDFISNELSITKKIVKHWVQNFTIKQVVEKLSIPRSTLVYYLNKLQKKGFLESETQKTGKRGRPSKLFKFTKKITKKLKQIKNQELRRNNEL